jgi:RNA polymerase Rpc34 subunit
MLSHQQIKRLVAWRGRGRCRWRRCRCAALIPHRRVQRTARSCSGLPISRTHTTYSLLYVFRTDVSSAYNVRSSSLSPLWYALTCLYLFLVRARAVPSKEITGGIWYTGNEFDHAFIETLRSFVTDLVREHRKEGISLRAITERVRTSGIR